jgi:hypothetical protein
MALSVPPAAMNFLCKPSILYLIITLQFFDARRRLDPPVTARPVYVLHDGTVVVVMRCGHFVSTLIEVAMWECRLQKGLTNVWLPASAPGAPSASVAHGPVKLLITLSISGLQ